MGICGRAGWCRYRHHRRMVGRTQHLLLLTHVCEQVASILALNPSMGQAEKRAFVRRFLKNAARPEEESRKLLDSGM